MKNFKRDFLKTTFFQMVVMISQVLVDRLASNLEGIFGTCVFIIQQLSNKPCSVRAGSYD